MSNKNMFINGGFPLIIPKDIKVIEPKPRFFSNKNIIDINTIINNNKRHSTPLVSILAPNDDEGKEDANSPRSTTHLSDSEPYHLLPLINNLHVKPLQDTKSLNSLGIKRNKQAKKLSKKISKKKSR